MAHRTPIPFNIALGIAVLAAAAAAAAPGDHLWSHAFNAESLAVSDRNGGAALAASFYGTQDFGDGPVSAGNPSGDLAIVRYAPDGSILWLEQITPASGVMTNYAIATGPDGGVFIGGYLWFGTVDFGGGPLTGSSRAYLASFAPDGQHRWSRLVGQFTVRSLSVADGRLAVVGGNDGEVDFGGGPLTASGFGDVCAAVLDLDGDHVWSRQWGDAEFQTALGGGLDAAGNLTMAVSVRGTVDFGGVPLVSPDIDLGLVSLDPAGDHRWSRLFSGTFNPFGTIEAACAVADDGRSALTGYLSGTADLGGGPLAEAGGGDAFVAVFDQDGGHLWSRTIGAAGADLGLDASFDGLGNLAVTGRFQGTVDFGGGPLASAGQSDLYLAVYDAGGQHQASRVFGGSMNDGRLLVDHQADGALLVEGFAQIGFDIGGGVFTSGSAFVAQLEGLGGGQTTAVAADGPPRAAVLGAAYPNPFNPQTTLRFRVERAMPVRLAVHDASGRRLAVLADGLRQPGDHEVAWRAQDAAGRPLPSGVYLVRLETPDGVRSGKVSLLK